MDDGEAGNDGLDGGQASPDEVMDRLVAQTASVVASLRRQAASLHAVAGVPPREPGSDGARPEASEPACSGDAAVG